MINIAGMKKEHVLLALYRAAKSKGIGELFTQTEMPLSAAAELVKNNPSLYFDYVNGRPLKVDLSGDEFDPYLYDRDNGEGVAQEACARYKSFIRHRLMAEDLEGDRINERLLSSKLDDYDSLITERFHLPKMVDLRGSVKIEPVAPTLPFSGYFKTSAMDIKSVQDGYSADPTTIDGLKLLLNESINEPVPKGSLPIMAAKHASVDVCTSILIDIINLKGLLFLLTTAYVSNGRYVPDIDGILNIDVKGIVQASINKLKYVRLGSTSRDNIEIRSINVLSGNKNVQGLVDKLTDVTKRLNNVSLINWFENTDLSIRFFEFWEAYNSLCIQNDKAYNYINRSIRLRVKEDLVQDNREFAGGNNDISPDQVYKHYPDSWYVNMRDTLPEASPLARVRLNKLTEQYLGPRHPDMPKLPGDETRYAIDVYWLGECGKVFYNHHTYPYPLTFKEAEELLDVYNNSSDKTTLARIVRIFPRKQ